MRAIQLAQPGGLDNLQLAELGKREPGPGEVLVRVQASSLNFHDYVVALGLLPVDDKRIPMSDGAGIVDAVGDGVTEFAVGDAVISTFFPLWQDGLPNEDNMLLIPGDRSEGFAVEYATMPASAFTHAPQGYSAEEGATLPCAALTAWRALMVEGKVKPGDTVLVQGTGGVSIFALQFAKVAGCKVIATSSSAAKLERLKDLGADELINYKENENWGELAWEMTGKQGVDVVVEIGGAGTIPQSIKAVRYAGHISVIGVLTGFAGEIPTAELFQKNAVMHGITVGSVTHQRDMVAAINVNGIKPVIDSSYDLADIGNAFRHQESQQHFGKICLSI